MSHSSSRKYETVTTQSLTSLKTNYFSHQKREKHLPKKAVGDIMPVRLATKMVVPDSKKGDVKSTAASLSALIFKEVRTMSNFFATNSPIKPFHLPFYD